MLRAAFPFAVLIALQASAVSASPCSTEIETVSKQLHEEGREAISASTSGKAVAGAREGQGVTETGGSEKSAQAGEGSEKVQAAKVALDEARTLDGKGDAEGCGKAVERAKKTLAEAP